MICGNSGVGKTALFNLAHKKRMSLDNLQVTMNATFAQVKVQINDPSVDDPFIDLKLDIKLQLWDTVGNEKFFNVTRNAYVGADAVVIVFDITHAESLTDTLGWAARVREIVPEHCKVILAGNKSDLLEQREVPTHMAENFAQENKFDHFCETSALERHGVDELFDYVAEAVYTSSL